MKIKEKYTYSYIIKYVPKIIETDNLSIIKAREDVYNFMNGKADEKYINALIEEIWDVIRENPKEWCICFIPASTETRTEKRYSLLIEKIKKSIHVEIYIKAVMLIDREPMHTAKNKESLVSDYIYDVNSYYGKRVLLIDDLINTGKTFKRIGDMLMETGAVEVYGLFFAKTIHPVSDKNLDYINIKKD